ncbi:STE20-related kinase adapter protein alpha-like isoform X1 [Lytechinus pictus]|uniref:STE20-related kinase adapter protein alpha-like isoform X1 n=1 Tax=Lytechinus pictus TaxID=7653 RepID=UPI0030BA26B2
MADVEYEGDARHYTLLTLIGRNFEGNAVVHIARHCSSGNLVAVRRVNLDKVKDSFAELRQECHFSKLMQHEQILPHYTSFVNGNELWVVMPLMEHGSARDLLDRNCPDGLKESVIAQIMRDVVLALDYIHRMGYIHRSVKASHILLTQSGGVHLSGLRTAVSMVEDGKRLKAVYDFPSLTTVRNLPWLATEVLEQNLLGYDTKSDIYSVGITACELSNGCVPFSDMVPMKMLLEKINGTTPKLLDCSTLCDVDGVPPQEPGSRVDSGIGGSTGLANVPNPYDRRFSTHFHDFMEVCLRREPVDRPSASQLLQHPFFKQVRKSSSDVLGPMLQAVHPLSQLREGKVDDQSEYIDNSEVGNIAEAVQRFETLDMVDPWEFD